MELSAASNGRTTADSVAELASPAASNAVRSRIEQRTESASSEEQARARDERIQALWATGRDDPQWTDRTVLLTREMLARPELAGLEVTDASCKTAMCQVRIRPIAGADPQVAGGAHQRIESAWLEHGPNDVDVLFSQGSNGDEQTVYMFKPETSPMRLPTPNGK